MVAAMEQRGYIGSENTIDTEERREWSVAPGRMSNPGRKEKQMKLIEKGPNSTGCPPCPVGTYENHRQEVIFFLYNTEETKEDLKYWLQFPGGEIDFFEYCPYCGRELIPKAVWSLGMANSYNTLTTLQEEAE
ncbi:MAG: hypothetical protein JW950_12440 [Deltaproteobacteria bacterium]|nr:hypothetical protein [Deltaproteobacteria bacterium]